MSVRDVGGWRVRISLRVVGWCDRVLWIRVEFDINGVNEWMVCFVWCML